MFDRREGLERLVGRLQRSYGEWDYAALPFTTFGEAAAFGLEAHIYCPSCYTTRQLDPTAHRLRDQCFATTRFQCTNVRWTGETCGGPGSVTIRPAEPLPVGGDVRLAFLPPTQDRIQTSPKTRNRTCRQIIRRRDGYWKRRLGRRQTMHRPPLVGMCFPKLSFPECLRDLILQGLY